MVLDSMSLITGQIVFGSLLAIFFFFLHTVYPELKGSAMICAAMVVATICRFAYLSNSIFWTNIGQVLSVVASLLIFLSVKQQVSNKRGLDRQDYCMIAMCCCFVFYPLPGVWSRFSFSAVIAIMILRLGMAIAILRSPLTERPARAVLGYFMVVYGLYTMMVPDLIQKLISEHQAILTRSVVSQSIFMGNVIFSAAMGLLFLLVFGEDIIYQLRQQSMLDSLTGALNRRGIEFYLAEEMRRCREMSQTFSLAILDIDEFKAINDTFGHAAGDQALCELVDLLRGEIRANDRIGRLGGDEIVIVFPQIRGRAALVVSERICDVIAEKLFKSSIRLTISIGVTEYSERDSIETLLRHADIALYNAKRSGKSCARLMPPDVLPELEEKDRAWVAL